MPVAGSRAMVSTTWLGTPVAPAPLISVQLVPTPTLTSMVCQTWPTFTPPMVTHTSLGLAGLIAIPLIQPAGPARNVGAPAELVKPGNAGRFPVMATQSVRAGTAPEFPLRDRTPYRLLVRTGPITPVGLKLITSRRSPLGLKRVPLVRSALMAVQPAGPAGTPPVAEYQIRLVPATIRCGLEGSKEKGATKPGGAAQAGSGMFVLSRAGIASPKEVYGVAGRPASVAGVCAAA